MTSGGKGPAIFDVMNFLNFEQLMAILIPRNHYYFLPGNTIVVKSLTWNARISILGYSLWE